MKKSIFNGGKLRDGTCMVHPGLFQRLVIAIVLVNFCVFMVPEKLWGTALPDISIMPNFIQQNIMFSNFQKSALVFWLLAPVSFVVIMALWVISVWREESEDMENLSILDYRSLMVFAGFFYRFQ